MLIAELILVDAQVHELRNAHLKLDNLEVAPHDAPQFPYVLFFLFGGHFFKRLLAVYRRHLNFPFLSPQA